MEKKLAELKDLLTKADAIGAEIGKHPHLMKCPIVGAARAAANTALARLDNVADWLKQNPFPPETPAPTAPAK